MPELTDAQKVMRNNTGQDIAEQIRLLRLQIEGGGLPAGGVAGEIPVKASSAPYDVDWKYPQYSRPNLLDNWYFAGGGSQSGDGVFPINQRRQRSYSNADWSIDRWKLVSGSLQVTAAGLILNGTITQKLNSAISQPVTATVLTSSGIVPGQYDEQTQTFTIVSSGGTILAAKLEIGGYQTLAHNDGTVESPSWVLNALPDYGQELAKCQRYYFKLPANPRFPASFRTTSAIYFSIYLPVTMHSGAKLYAPNMTGIFAYINGEITEQTGFSFSTEGDGGITPYVNGSGAGIFTVTASKTSHGLLASPGIELRLGSGVYLSAE